jgi:hypothetical protein
LSSRKKLHTGCAVGFLERSFFFKKKGLKLLTCSDKYLEVSEFCGGMALGVAGIWRPVFSGWSSGQVGNV